MKTAIKQPCKAERLIARAFRCADDWVGANPAFALLLGLVLFVVVLVLFVHGIR